VFCQCRKFGQGLAARKQTLFAASNQDADSCGERNTEQLAGIDSVLLINAQNVIRTKRTSTSLQRWAAFTRSMG
jgi:hypothetical protein